MGENFLLVSCPPPHAMAALICKGFGDCCDSIGKVCDDMCSGCERIFGPCCVAISACCAAVVAMLCDPDRPFGLVTVAMIAIHFLFFCLCLVSTLNADQLSPGCDLATWDTVQMLVCVCHIAYSVFLICKFQTLYDMSNTKENTAYLRAYQILV